MIARFIGFLFLSFLSSALAHAGNGWSDVAYPLPGPPRVIGSYTSGCIAGAVTLPLLGDGYQVMRPSRNRYYGHPQGNRAMWGVDRKLLTKVTGGS
jgi:penicillin-insensitive murein endopeptidase